MTPKEKAEELYSKFEDNIQGIEGYEWWESAKQCALIAVENEYNSLREQLFNLRSCRVITSEKVYLHRLDYLINEEKQVKIEIEKL
jgi:hypothetical protein